MTLEEAKKILEAAAEEDSTYLDDFVLLDVPAEPEEAAAINNGGFDEQWGFLLMAGGAEYLIELAARETGQEPGDPPKRAVSDMGLREWFSNPQIGVRKDTGNGTFDLLVEELVFRQRKLGEEWYQLVCDQFPGLRAEATTIRGCEDKLWNMINLDMDNHVGQHLFKRDRDLCPLCQAGDYMHVGPPPKE